MSELSIQRNRGFAVTRRQTAPRAEKPGPAGQGQGKTGLNISETLRQLLTRAGQAEQQIRESRRTLRTGESALAEAGDQLERMAETARQAAAGGDPAALQAELARLAEEIDRILGSAEAGGTRLFLDEAGGAEDGGALLSALSEETSAPREAALPDWLLSGLGNKGPTADRILAALGLDRSAGSAEILAAVMDSPLETSGAASYLATLYLGASIAGADRDPASAREGLGQLLEMLGTGVSLDEAISQLTNGEFTGLEDFQAQFTGGAAPGLENFLEALLLTGENASLMDMEALLALMAETGRMDLELALLDMLNQLELHQTLGAGPEPEVMAGPESPEVMNAAGSGKTSVLDCGAVRVLSRDLSGTVWDAETGTLTVRGTAALLGTGEELPSLRLAGGGTVTLQNVRAAVLTVEGQSQAAGFGRNVLGELRMEPGASLTLGGGGFVRADRLRGDASNTLRLTGGGAVLAETAEKGAEPVPVVLEGPVSLAAGSGVTVSGPRGAALEPFDGIWKALLPGWTALTSLEADGRQVKMALLNGDPARLWLDRGDRGAPAHVLVLRGRDAAGQPKTRYAYLHWNQQTGRFEEISMYPNPFAVIGGEPGRDWAYEEHTHTLRIRSSQVTGISGGRGTDSNQTPFSGRIALDDGIGTMALTLGGVVCRVSQGRAFHLGRGNDVTLTLESGSRNLFESGEGCAGLSLGEGTSLRIERDGASGGRTPEGSLTAIGSGGGAGIGRDSGGGRDQTSRILVRGGRVKAAGNGGGAGIGAGKNGAMGPVTILGGQVESTGEKGGGAGIGGGLGGAVGDISIQGGTVAAVAAGHAAAIGAGVQGACGDIRIAGTARILKALGGDPGADIGACLFGGCGSVRVSADIGNARLRTRSGVSLKAGDHTVTLPQFRLSARSLGLDRLSLATREEARAAQASIDAGRRWVAQVQSAYGALYGHLGGSGGLWSSGGGPVRDTDLAGALLRELSEAIALQAPGQTGAREEREQVRQLLR